MCTFDYTQTVVHARPRFNTTSLVERCEDAKQTRKDHDFQISTVFYNRAIARRKHRVNSLLRFRLSCSCYRSVAVVVDVCNRAKHDRIDIRARDSSPVTFYQRISKPHPHRVMAHAVQSTRTWL